MDRQEIMARLLRARDDVDGVLDTLVQGNDSKVSWTRLLAHHVNNQLTSIFFIIDRFIQADATDAEQATYVTGLKDVADRIQETIRRLMTVSQFDSLVTLADVSVRAAVVEAVRRARGYASLKSIVLETALDLDGSTSVRADKIALVEALMNLLGNAIKYSPPNSTVRVSASLTADSVVYRVTDQGPGICPEEQARLFKVGSVLSTRPTAGEPQTGIGLAMTFELVKAMGGTIWCESAVGKGSTFVIRLPIETAGRRSPT